MSDMPWSCDECVRLSVECDKGYPCRRCAYLKREACTYTPPPSLWAKSSCAECRARHVRCVYGNGKNACSTCEVKGKDCLYTLTDKVTSATVRMRVPTAMMVMDRLHPITPTTVEHIPTPGKSPGPVQSSCSCNTTFRVQLGTREQGASLYSTVEAMFTLETALEIGEAELGQGLPFPLIQVRLQVASPRHSSNMERHIIAQGEPMVTEFHAVESVLNILRAVPEGLYRTTDVQIMTEALTLKWNSDQLGGRFQNICSACLLPKDRG